MTEVCEYCGAALIAHRGKKVYEDGKYKFTNPDQVVKYRAACRKEGRLVAHKERKS